MNICGYRIEYELLGSGRFGDVLLVELPGNKEKIALKVIDKKDIKSHKMISQIEKEIDILSTVNHPYIIKMKDNFDDDKNIYLTFEYCPGGDFYIKIKEKPLEDAECKKYIRQLCEAVKYLHSLNIIHRDIKTDNILLDRDDNIKLADFGWATRSYNNKEKLLCGTPDYLAPELISKQEYDKRIDIWCIGVTTYELLTGTLPFTEDSTKKTYDNIISKNIDLPNGISEDAKDFIIKVLQKNPDYRLTIDQMLDHPWLSIDKELVDL